jgi:hypothetical protein
MAVSDVSPDSCETPGDEKEQRVKVLPMAYTAAVPANHCVRHATLMSVNELLSMLIKPTPA